ncbi:MAG: ATP-binding cassette domain-containing protein [Clostridia bacterium]|nr:ATP-binding cassette domain-containing protein [Clostridia bacterium]
MTMNKVLLEINDIRKEFVKDKNLLGKAKSVLLAVDGVSLTIHEGEILGLVGESGCGKSTLGRMIVKLCEPTGGQILFEGADITYLKQKEMRDYRRQIQIIFQDPYASLNPRMTVLQAVRAPLDAFQMGTRAERDERTAEALSEVGLTAEYLKKYPHEMSGGQRQRAAIARAMILRPKLVVCDEPVSALDVSVRAQVLNLMKTLQQQKQAAYLFISHDLSVTHHLCDRIAVMYMGKLVETAEKDELYQKPLHPYTQALLASIPLPVREHKRKHVPLEGDVPSPLNPPKGCRFHERCKYAAEICKTEEPRLREVGCGHCIACHFDIQGEVE